MDPSNQYMLLTKTFELPLTIVLNEQKLFSDAQQLSLHRSANNTKIKIVETPFTISLVFILFFIFF